MAINKTPIISLKLFIKYHGVTVSSYESYHHSTVHTTKLCILLHSNYNFQHIWVLKPSLNLSVCSWKRGVFFNDTNLKNYRLLVVDKLSMCIGYQWNSKEGNTIWLFVLWRYNYQSSLVTYPGKITHMKRVWSNLMCLLVPCA